MPIHFFKPVVWNDQGYALPGGAKFTSGYPKEHGFGHEEWNNSDRLEYEENGQRFRTFHTEGFGNQPLSAYDGDIFLVMISSHQGRQYAVAIAGAATSLFDKRREPERRRLAKELGVRKFWKDAWALNFVRKKYQEDQKRFRKFWNARAVSWFATWKCPAELYLGLKQPLLLDPMKLVGRERLITMYSSYQQTDRATMLRILDRVPASEGPTVARLRALCDSDDQDIQADVEQIESNVKNETTRLMLIQARLGQGRFRDDLLRIWNSSCAVTGCSITEILRASHIKPWRKCLNNKEKLDPQNGLLLSAHIDALFDCGLISFQDDGAILISTRVSLRERKNLGLGPESKLRRKPTPALRRFLYYHRRCVGRDLP
jgi:hypothetical protein